jgi:hypothetical protein
VVTSSQTTDRLTDGVGADGEKLPIQMLNDRVLVHLGGLQVLLFLLVFLRLGLLTWQGRLSDSVEIKLSAETDLRSF